MGKRISYALGLRPADPAEDTESPIVTLNSLTSGAYEYNDVGPLDEVLLPHQTSLSDLTADQVEYWAANTLDDWTSLHATKFGWVWAVVAEVSE